MKKLSIKIKITVWYLLLMGLMAGLIVAFLLAISGSVYSQNAMEQLDQTLRTNLSQVSMSEGSLALGETFQFYQNGVYTLIYSQNEALLAGQVPVAFTAQEPFENGLTRLVHTGSSQYYVLDFWLPVGWEGGLWVRGLLEAPDRAQSMPALLWVAVVTLPLFLLLAAVGGYWIARRAFRPLEDITATADAISQASDLSARVTVPPGSNEFTRLASTFNQMFARLERSFEAETQFTADASHELRTPVSVIKSACEYAEKYGETPEEQRETIAMIHRQADKMSQLIGQLLSITRLDQGTETARREKIDLTDLVRTVCAEGPWPADGLVLEAGGPLLAWADKALITRLLQNLIDNGFKYGKPGGHVWVSLGTGPGEVLLTVRDDGKGIPPAEQEKVWQRFYQVDPARGEKSGAGLGLSMVQKIAQAHGGYMTLESDPAWGSAFTLHLPHREPER
ncbi:MAG TPA: HAMP domain-containing histidine kinase [Candidatus Evtepia faecigallinarum]|nr:HAMP domain-containing histidine kinase [Candidatus Evtepia faecigallinarum]